MANATDVRMCFTCYTEKPTDQFKRPNQCRECVNRNARRHYRNNSEKLRKVSSARYHANREHLKQRGKELYVIKHAAAVKIYGGACVKCGATDDLEFDHVNRDGAEHRNRESNQMMVRRIARLGAPLPDVELQLLCRPHHYEKTAGERRARAQRDVSPDCGSRPVVRSTASSQDRRPSSSASTRSR